MTRLPKSGNNFNVCETPPSLSITVFRVIWTTRALPTLSPTLTRRPSIVADRSRAEKRIVCKRGPLDTGVVLSHRINDPFVGDPCVNDACAGGRIGSRNCSAIPAADQKQTINTAPFVSLVRRECALEGVRLWLMGRFIGSTMPHLGSGYANAGSG